MTFALTTGEQLTREIDAMIDAICPNAGRRPMYGGCVFETESGNSKTMVCGHFIYTKHVSLEFSNGYLLHGHDNVLAGNGKLRRHIKLTDSSDIQTKLVRSMIKQAFSNAGVKT